MKRLNQILQIAFLIFTSVSIYCQIDDVNDSKSIACDTIIEYAENVIWGLNGEGQFDGGLNGWTVECEADTCWAWTEDTIISGSFFTTTMISPTACNGFMSFNSDSYDVPPDDGPWVCLAPCSGSLISPAIDLSESNPEGLFLQFTQNYKQWMSEYFIVFSYDEGMSYQDTIFLNEDAIESSEEIKETLRIPIASYEGQSSIQFKFYHIGNYFHWEIDDVLLIEDSYVDMQVNEDWFASAPQYKTPISQAAEMPFMINLFNNGNVDAEDVQVKVEIERNGTSLFSTTKPFGIVEGYSLNENMVFPALYIPNGIGEHKGTYSVSSSSGNEDINNDQLSFNFNVTENTFASIPNEDEGLPFQHILEGSQSMEGGSMFTRNYAIARLFYIRNGDGYTISDVTFALDDLDPNASGFVNAHLLKVTIDEDQNDLQISEDQTSIVGIMPEKILIIDGQVERFNTIQLVASDENGIPITDDNEEFRSIALEDRTVYAIVISTQANDDEQIGILGAPYFDETAESGQYSSGACGLAFLESGLRVIRTGTYFAPLIDGVSIEIKSSDFQPWYENNEVYLEWTIEESTISSNNTNQFSGISIYPNPTSDRVWINFDLANNMELVVLELTDLNGKLIKTRSYQNLKDSQIDFDLTNIPTGMYHLNIIYDDEITTKKLMIE